MIRSFADRDTRRLFVRRPVPRLRSIEYTARQSLEALHAAASLLDLAQIPGNRLEKLGGDLAGHYSIRINRPWRIIFAWRDGDAYEVRISKHYR
jgi:proteic killer suppression protein